MIAIDTNLLVRYITNDDPLQARQALAVLAGREAVFVSRTVLLELEWMLRAAYGLPREAIEHALLTILGLPSVVPEHPTQIALALEGYRQGLDFADALHYTGAEQARGLLTFDKKMLKRAREIGWRVLPVPGAGA